MLETSPGVFYGIAVQGGTHSMGGIWKYTLSSKTYKKIGDFDNSAIGHEPISNFVKVGNDLFGVLAYRNDINKGHLYKVNTSTDALEYYHELHPNPPVGIVWDSHEKPFGDIVYNSTNNTIYGTNELFLVNTNYGGGVWSINLTNNDVRNLKGIFLSDATSLGKNANGMVQASNGNLYVITRNGGVNKHGTLLRYDIGTNQYFKLLDFPSGLHPSGIGLQASGTKIFGAYLYNGGLWTYDITTNTFDNNIAHSDMVDLNFIVKGNEIIGRSANGGNADAGYFFSYNHDSKTMNIIQNNVSPQGRNMIGELALMGDSAAVVYIAKGGAYTSNTKVCETGMLSIYNFKNNTFTDIPNSTKLLMSGVNYESHLSSRALVTSHKKIYFTAYYEYGSNFDNYTMIRCYDLNTQTLSLVKELKANNTTLVGLSEVNGKLYVAYDDSAFVINPTDNSIIKALQTHDASTSGDMAGNLVLASDGKLYGLTNGNDPNSKIALFSLDTLTLAYNVEYQFDSFVRTANIGLTELNGKLYGSTNYGGANNNGFLFSYELGNSQFTKIHDFDYTADGGNFQASWTPYNGKLYSTSYTGGQKGYGTLVSYEPATTTFSTITHLSVNNGRSFKGSPVVIPAAIVTSSSALNNTGSNNEVAVYPNPSNGMIYISSSQKVESIEVYTASGVKVMSDEGKDNYNLSQLPYGMYVVKIHTQDGQTSTQKVMLSK